MSVPKKNAKKNPENTSLEWAEKLKASMNDEIAESDRGATFTEEDDLAALLRAQLGKSSETSSFMTSLDTSEFETDEEESEDFDEEEFEDSDEEEFEDPVDEEFEDSDEEEFEDPVDEEFEDSDEEEFEDSDEEEFEDSDEEELEDPVDEEFEDADEEEFEDSDEEEFEDADEEEFEDSDEEEFEDSDEEEFEDSDEEEFEDAADEEFEDPVDEEFEDSDEEEFEDAADEEFEDSDEEEFEDAADEEFEDVDEEEFEDADEEEFEDPIDEEFEDSEDEEFEDADEEEFEDSEDEEFEDAEDEEFEDADEEEFEDSDEEEFEDSDEEEFEDVEDEEFDDTSEEEELTMGASSMPPMYYRRPIQAHVADSLLNGLSPHETAGGSRLQALDEQNTRLLEEETRFLSAWDTSADDDDLTDATTDKAEMSNVDETDSEESTQAAEAESGSVGRLPILVRDPLQLGLDDISPLPVSTVKAPVDEVEALPAEEQPEPGENATYSEIMAGVSEAEESLRDTEMIMRLGYESALHHIDEQEQIGKIREDFYENREISALNESVPAEYHQEYRGRVDTNRVEDSYVQSKRKNMARVCVAGVGAVLAILYDLLPLLVAKDTVATLFDIRWIPPVGLLLLVLTCIPFLSRIGKGLKSLMDFEPTRYAVAGMGILVSLIQGVFACVVGDPYRLPLFVGTSLVMLLIAALSEYFITEGEHRAFAVVSCGKPIHVLTHELTPVATELHRIMEETGDDGKQAAHTSRQPILTVVRAGRVADYFARTNRYNPYMGRLNYLLPIALLASILSAGLSLLMGGTMLEDGVRVFTATYLSCLPAAYLLAMTLPLYHANKTLGKKGSAVIGSAAPTEYAEKHTAHLIFDDGDALKSLYRKDITLRGDGGTEEFRRMADWIFRMLNTPLAVEPAVRDGSMEDYRIDIAEVHENYMRLYLTDCLRDTTTEVMMGSHEALARCGIRLPKISMEQRYKKSEGSHVLYMAFNRSFHLAYAVEYRVGRTFAHVAMALAEKGYKVSISAYDPMVNPDMDGINRLRKYGPLEVLRPEEYEPIRKVRSGGLVATGRSMDLIQPLFACHDMKRAYRLAHLVSWLSIPVALGLSALAICLGSESFLFSGTATVWQILHAVMMILIGRRGGRNRSNTREADKEKAPADVSRNKKKKTTPKKASH